MKLEEKYNLSDRDVDRIVGMAWEDRTPFDAILEQFGVPEKDVIRLMKQEMKLRNWKKWRARVQGRKTKHRALREMEVKRFKSGSQRFITKNHISKKKY
ncbi:MAG: TIGR03643 family protein [Saprospiraceae bacterium]|nr:TIGR03643 family protein [Saprospiraceae bacterium]